MTVALLPVHGMFCPDCVSRLRAALQKVPGVQRVVIDLGGRSCSPVLVALDPDGSRQSVAAAVHDAGFTTTNLTNESRS
ncbi:heavy metal transporter [Intrasporangium chromatireducens Q5-1]|uniref:Heavy metal transporter n=1 Tax=Intrasporangium chromatireducens Q5-1 TaxID=584657 RepID=W9GSD4_9MICO|nr:heavy metal-associated domain-containing protein [Intrasporangium chromatireducens]EWT07738.1 heavy metal transporter [Intrasporangium chromatireducens Q5-1]